MKNIKMENKEKNRTSNLKMYVFIVGMSIGAVVGAFAYYM